MDLVAFQQLVRDHEHRLRGVHPETAEALEEYERDLGFPLPPSMKWLLSEYGYTMSSGVDNLEESVALTIRCRRDIRLPDDILLVNDWNDGGLVFCLVDDRDDHEYEFIWSDTADIYALIDGKPLPDDVSRYPSFGEWVQDRLVETEDE
jgi:hypothetical protein